MTEAGFGYVYLVLVTGGLLFLVGAGLWSLLKSAEERRKAVEGFRRKPFEAIYDLVAAASVLLFFISVIFGALLDKQLGAPIVILFLIGCAMFFLKGYFFKR